MTHTSRILNIESDSEHVKITFCYINPYDFGAWVDIGPNCFIRPINSDVKLVLLKTEEMPIKPDRIEFEKSGDMVYYSLIFPPLPKDVTEIDIIEDEQDRFAFNFFNVSLIKNNTIMTTNSTGILKKIEQLAIDLKGENKTTKSYLAEINRLESRIAEIADFLKLSKEETVIFCLAIYISVTTDRFSISELKYYTNFSPFDFFEIKNTIKVLLKKGWLIKTGNAGTHRGNRRVEEKIYNIPPTILEDLHKDNAPEIKKKEMDVYIATEMLHKSLREYIDNEMEDTEMMSLINEYEEEYIHLHPFKLAKNLELEYDEKMILYYLVTKTFLGDEIVEVDRMVSNLFNLQIDRMKIKKQLSKRESILFKNKIIDFVNEDFKTDKQIKLTTDGTKIIFGEDACFLKKDDDFSSGICKLINHESIIEKELYYNQNEQNSINTVSEFLKVDKFKEIITRLEENKMRPGLTILLHGHPGTGKTETIYQLAKQTKRNIILVNISEIRDKFVGESEKRLKSVFETYENSIKHFEQTPILLFNESDALIGKRINVNNSVDQMNNSMQNILLQELEDFKGIMMATTNLTSNLDEAFERRFLFKIKYERPSMEAKTSIWKNKLSFLTEEDASRLANEFDISGGQIENISRKIFLDSILLGKTYTIEDTFRYCEEELLANQHKSKKIGF